MKAPSIIIGAGGIGSSICARVAEMMPANAPDRHQTRFVVMDTDVNTIREIQRKGFRGTAICLSNNMTVGKCKDLMRDQIADWYPQGETFNKKSMTEGAGQQRAISRLALEYSLREGKLRPLHRVINELHEISLQHSSQPITFYIISSLAGGTGSGIVLPLSLYLNRYVVQKQGDALSSCKGFFLLSNVLEESVDSALEVQSLDANSYAALKELSAFMQVEDGDSEEGRYQNLEHAFSLGRMRRRGGGGWWDHSYEYCFLFGLRNVKGHGIHSPVDLQNMVARAVYMQACSPMQARNSSREDNKVRHNSMLQLKNSEAHMRRFGGIGCGELCYPEEQLREYFSLCWAKDVMQGQWKKYDELYRTRELEEVKKKSEGQKWIVVERGQEYINAVCSDNQSSLAHEILHACQTDDGRNTWDCYLEALWNEIVRMINAERDSNTINPSRNERALNDNLCVLTSNGRKKKLFEAADQVNRLFKDINAGVSSVPAQYESYLSKAWFTLHPLNADLPEHYMEYWLTNKGQFIHPNAIRYFLYQLRQAIEAKKQSAQKESDNIQSQYSDFLTKEPLRERKVFPYSRSKYMQYHDNYEAALNDLYRFAQTELFKRILGKCGEYVDKLTTEYERFYDSYDQLLLEFDDRISLIAEELDRDQGVSWAYVCANRLCREKAIEEIRSKEALARVDGALSYYLFQMMCEERWKKIDDETRFQDMRAYWMDGLKTRLQRTMCSNILHAIDKEEFYKNGIRADAQMLRIRIEQAKEELASPLVQFDLKNYIDRNHGITIYCYNTTLEKETGVYQQVVKWFKGQEGVDDPFYCSPFQIVFYYSFIGLSAAELLDYLHGPAVTLPMGPAFLSYEDMVVDLGKGQGGVTPHSSREWHNFNYMPDPQKHYQFQQEVRMGTAFLYAYLKDKIVPDSHGGLVGYRFKKGEQWIRKNRLVDCFEVLYWDQSLFHEWSRSMQAKLSKIWPSGEDPVDKLLNQKCLWELFWICSQELNKRTWPEHWRNIMLYAGKQFVVECMSGIEEPDRRFDWGKVLHREWEKLKEIVGAANQERMSVEGEGRGKISNQELLKEIKDFCSGVLS